MKLVINIFSTNTRVSFDLTLRYNYKRLIINKFLFD